MKNRDWIDGLADSQARDFYAGLSDEELAEIDDRRDLIETSDVDDIAFIVKAAFKAMLNLSNAPAPPPVFTFEALRRNGLHDWDALFYSEYGNFEYHLVSVKPEGNEFVATYHGGISLDDWQDGASE